MQIDKAQLRAIDKKLECDDWGKYSRIFWTKEKVEALGLEYKEGRAYKLLMGKCNKQVEAQKIAILHTFLNKFGISPKVYNIGQVNGYWYIETDKLDRLELKISEATKNKIKELATEYGFFEAYEIDLDKGKNYIGDMYVDFHGFKLNKKEFESWLSKQIDEITHWGRKDNGRVSYQSDSHIKGKRDCMKRITDMELDKINYFNQTLTDLGCSLGIFSHYANSRGAIVTGIDTPEVIFLAELYKFNYYPKSKVTFIAKNLSKNITIKPRDIVFNFAMVHTIGRPRELANITRRLCVYEGHNLEDKNKTEPDLKKIFPKVRFLGYTEDRGKRPIFWCKK